ncbi:MAG: FHA domain-containing protein [Anaerolineales bacterium]|nr:FHA domain-containing protein [Anaerolineales bacterium]
MEFARELPGLAAGQVIELSAPRYLIGRAAACDLCLDDARISRRHTEFVWDAERYGVADCQSANGTFVNNERLAGDARRVLKDGDEIAVGSLLVLRFHDDAATVAEARPAQLRRGLALGPSREEVFVNFKPLDPPLAELQYRLLRALVQKKGELVTLDEAAQAIWPELEAVSDAMLDNQVARLRQRLDQLDPQHDYIERIRSKGLRFVQRP